MSDLLYTEAEDVIKGRVGRKLRYNSDYAALRRNLGEGEHLYAGYETIGGWEVVCVDEKSVFDRTLKHYRQGQLDRLEFYALTGEEHKKSSR